MIVSHPFTIRKDVLETKTVEMGTVDSLMSQIALFFSCEEGEVSHMPNYGIRKQDLLFGADLDEATLGVFLMRCQEKVAEWFDGVEVTDVNILENPQNNKRARLAITCRYNEEDMEVEVYV